MIAADWFSRYLRIQPLKRNHATTAAEAFKQKIKHKEPKI